MFKSLIICSALLSSLGINALVPYNAFTQNYNNDIGLISGQDLNTTNNSGQITYVDNQHFTWYSGQNHNQAAYDYLNTFVNGFNSINYTTLFYNNTDFSEFGSIRRNPYYAVDNNYRFVPLFQVGNAYNYFGFTIGYPIDDTNKTIVFYCGGVNSSESGYDLLPLDKLCMSVTLGLLDDDGTYSTVSLYFSTLPTSYFRQYNFITANNSEYIYLNVSITYNTEVVTIDNYQEGYLEGWQIGYDTGLNDSTPNISAFGDLLFAIADTPIIMLQSLFSFDLFGVSVFVAIMSLITLLLVLYIVRRIL